MKQTHCFLFCPTSLSDSFSPFLLLLGIPKPLVDSGDGHNKVSAKSSPQKAAPYIAANSKDNGPFVDSQDPICRGRIINSLDFFDPCNTKSEFARSFWYKGQAEHVFT